MRHSLGHPVFRDTLGDTRGDTSGPSGPSGLRDHCSRPRGSQGKPRDFEGHNIIGLAKTYELGLA